MTSGPNTKFFDTINEHIFSLVKTLNTTITQLASVAQKKEMLVASITSLLREQAFTIQQLDDEPFLVCGKHVAENARTLLLFSHCPPQPNAFARWSTFVTRLLTIATYHTAIGIIPLNILWLIDTEEHDEDDEVLTRFIERNSTLLQGDGCLYDLPNNGFLSAPFLALGTKGLLSIEIEAQMSPEAHHSLYGSVLPNATWRLIWALNSLKDTREEIRIEGFYDTLVPMDDEEIALIRVMTENEQVLKQRLNVDEFLLHLHGFQLYYTYLLLPTCTVTRIQSAGDALEHTIPSSARASLDIHLVPAQDAEDIYIKVRKHLDAQGFQDIHTKARVSRNPQYTPLYNSFAKIVYDNTCALYEEDMPTFPLIPQPVAYYPLRSILNIPVVYVQTGYIQSQLYEHDTVSMVEDEERQKQFLVNSMKQLAMIIEGMIHATDIAQ